MAPTVKMLTHPIDRALLRNFDRADEFHGRMLQTFEKPSVVAMLTHLEAKFSQENKLPFLQELLFHELEIKKNNLAVQRLVAIAALENDDPVQANEIVQKMCQGAYREIHAQVSAKTTFEVLNIIPEHFKTCIVGRYTGMSFFIKVRVQEAYGESWYHLKINRSLDHKTITVEDVVPASESEKIVYF